MTPAARDLVTALVANTIKQAYDDNEPLDPHTIELLRAAMRTHPELATALTHEADRNEQP